MLGKPSRRTRKALEERGKRATATVMEIGERGMTVTSGNPNLVANTEVVLKAKLQVEPDDEPAFEVEQKFRFSQFGMPAVGQKIPVVYDPRDHEHVMLDEASAAGGPVDTAEMIKRIRDQAQAQAGVQNAAAFGFPAPATPQEDPVDKLAKLAELREKGMLTEGEFEAQKARILGES